MMDVEVQLPTTKDEEDFSDEQTDNLLKIKNIKSIHIKNWEDSLRKLAEKFVNSQNLQFGFIKLSGSYSLKLGGVVVIKLMQCQDGTDNKLMLGLLDTGSFNPKNWKGKTHQAYNVGVGEQRKTFYFYTVNEHNLDKMIELVNEYGKSYLGISESIDLWQDIPKNGICGSLLGLQYNTGLWTSQATADSAEDLQETDNIIPPKDELHLLIETERKKLLLRS
ncbi:MAG TPA: hypothetical protein GXZ91_02245 [Christensenellaceae bacterium]|jgi:hypothetical protein|nr:hypothetical protein [Christensenellaceae bacterium]